MKSRARPYRSVLYIPGSKPRALDKARGLPVDAIIFDLEDAVTPEEKVNARATLAEALAAGGYGARLKIDVKYPLIITRTSVRLLYSDYSY